MKKGLLLFIALGMLLAGSAYLLTTYFSHESVNASAKESAASNGAISVSDEPGNETEDKTIAPSKVSVLQLEGNVSRMTKQGDWKPIIVGQALGVDDAVRTDKKSKVTLGIGEESTIELAERAEVEVRELSDTVQKLGLVKGRASVDYKNDGERVLQFENSDGTAVAQVKKGKFSLMHDGKLLAVATETGSVDLTSGGQTVEVLAGMQSSASGDAPVRPYAIPVDVLLKIADSGCKKQTGNTVSVRGTVSVGTRVKVNGQMIKVDKSGAFVAYVVLASGRSNVVVVTEDILGRTNRRVVSCGEPLPKANIKKIDINWGAPKEKGSG